MVPVGLACIQQLLKVHIKVRAYWLKTAYLSRACILVAIACLPYDTLGLRCLHRSATVSHIGVLLLPMRCHCRAGVCVCVVVDGPPLSRYEPPRSSLLNPGPLDWQLPHNRHDDDVLAAVGFSAQCRTRHSPRPTTLTSPERGVRGPPSTTACEISRQATEGVTSTQGNHRDGRRVVTPPRRLPRSPTRRSLSLLRGANPILPAGAARRCWHHGTYDWGIHAGMRQRGYHTAPLVFEMEWMVAAHGRGGGAAQGRSVSGVSNGVKVSAWFKFGKNGADATAAGTFTGHPTAPLSSLCVHCHTPPRPLRTRLAHSTARVLHSSGRQQLGPQVRHASAAVD
jgi:hypothetical protein